MIINHKKYNYYLLIYFILFTLLLFITYNVSFANIGTSTGLKIPRFVSLKSNEVNLRVGPSKNYPKELQYIRKNLPVEIIEEYELWRKITDIDGNKGWLHKSLIKAERYAIVITEKNNKAFVFNNPKGKKIGEIGVNNIVKLNSCLKEWCLINSTNKKGWVSKQNLWGVYDNEVYKLTFIQPLKNLYWKILKIFY